MIARLPTIIWQRIYAMVLDTQAFYVQRMVRLQNELRIYDNNLFIARNCFLIRHIRESHRDQILALEDGAYDELSDAEVEGAPYMKGQLIFSTKLNKWAIAHAFLGDAGVIVLKYTVWWIPHDIMNEAMESAKNHMVGNGVCCHRDRNLLQEANYLRLCGISQRGTLSTVPYPGGTLGPPDERRRWAARMLQPPPPPPPPPVAVPHQYDLQPTVPPPPHHLLFTGEDLEVSMTPGASSSTSRPSTGLIDMEEEMDDDQMSVDEQ